MADWIVATNGNDSSGDGSVGNPYATISKALSVASPGDSILLRAGTYNQRFVPNKNQITLANYQDEEVWLRGVAGTHYIIDINNRNDTVVDGINLRYASSEPPVYNMPWCIVRGTSARTTLRNLRAVKVITSFDDELDQNWQERAISVRGGEDTEIDNLYATGMGYGVEIRGTPLRTWVHNSTISGVGLNCVVITHGNFQFLGTLFENCLLENAYREDGIHWRDIADPGTAHNFGTIIRNTVVRNCGENAFDFKGAAHILIEGCIVYGSVGSNNGYWEAPNRNTPGALMRGASTKTHSVIIRKTIVFDNNSGAILYDRFTIYNNTFIWNQKDIFEGSGSSYGSPPNSLPYFFGIRQQDGDSLRFVGIKNNVIANHPVTSICLRTHIANQDMDLDHNAHINNPPSTFASGSRTFYNATTWRAHLDSLGWDTAGEDNSIFTIASVTDAKFNNVPENPVGDGGHSQYDFGLQAASPLRGSGGHLTIAEGGGIGSSILKLKNPFYFTDGFGATTGDQIYIEGVGERTITALNYDTRMATLDRPATWSNGARVWLGDTDVVDIGAPAFGITNIGEDPPVVPSENDGEFTGYSDVVCAVTTAEDSNLYSCFTNIVCVGFVYSNVACATTLPLQLDDIEDILDLAAPSGTVGGLGRVHREIPRAPRADYILNEPRSWFSVVVPEQSVNLVYDPETLSFALGNQSAYEQVGGTTITPTSGRQRRGPYSILVRNITVPLAGIRYILPQAMAANQPYTFSCDHFGTGKYVLVIARLSDNSFIAAKAFEGKPFWQRLSITGAVSVGTSVYVAVLATDGFFPNQYRGGFHVDGLQFEPKPHATTFISGDLIGNPQETTNPYGWLGTPHLSASFRLASTRSGGRPVPLDEMGFELIEMQGLGLIEPEHQTTILAAEHGGLYQRTLLPQREFSLVGQLFARNVVDLMCQRQKIASAFDPLAVLPHQPVRMHFQLLECEEPVAPELELDVLYRQGMDMRINNHYGERVALSLGMADPFIRQMGEVGKELEINEEDLNNDSTMIARDPLGIWGRVPGAPVGDYQNMIVGPDGMLYVLLRHGENWAATEFWRWDGYGWTLLWDLNGQAYDMVVGPDNSIYIGGIFNVDTPGTVHVNWGTVYRYHVPTGVFDDLSGTVFSNQVLTVAYHKDGYLVAGGVFTTVENDNTSILTVNRVAAYRFATGEWIELGDGVTSGLPGTGNEVNALAVSSSGIIFAGGSFATDDLKNLASYTFLDPGWKYMDAPTLDGDAAAARVECLTFGPNDRLYIGGEFNDSELNDYTNNGFSPGEQKPLTCIAYYDGVGGEIRPPFVTAPVVRLEPVSFGVAERILRPDGTDIGPSRVLDIAAECDGTVWIVGAFTRVMRRLVGPVSLFPEGIYSPSIASFGPDLIWRSPEVIIAPQGVPGDNLPAYRVRTIELGGQCPGVFAGDPLGGTIPGSPVPGLDLGFPPGHHKTIFVGKSFTDDALEGALFPGVTNVDVGCSVDVKPLLRIRGPGRLSRIANLTNGTKISFYNTSPPDPGGYNLAVGEVLTVDLRGPLPKAYSNLGNNIHGNLVDIADLSRFHLNKGENRIQVVYNNLDLNGETNPEAKVFLHWTNRYTSLDVACVAECGV